LLCIKSIEPEIVNTLISPDMCFAVLTTACTHSSECSSVSNSTCSGNSSKTCTCEPGYKTASDQLSCTTGNFSYSLIININVNIRSKYKFNMTWTPKFIIIKTNEWQYTSVR
jgi:hypothetical protein